MRPAPRGGPRTEPGKAAQLASYYDAEMSERAARRLPEERERHRDLFIDAVARGGSVLEVGCGPGSDAAALAEAGLDYTGVDLAPGAAVACARQGFRACVADAVALPFRTGAFDALWTMSTLLHLDDGELGAALGEVRRVVRPGGLVAVGLWGAAPTREEHLRTGSRPARYFHLLSDDDLRRALETVGRLERWATWTAGSEPVHYQWALVTRTAETVGPSDPPPPR